MSKGRVFGNVTHRIDELDKTIKGVAKNILEISKKNVSNELDLKLRRSKLKKERLQALSLLARSRAVLAETEILIAENELYTDLCELKRKHPKSIATDSEDPKKAKISFKQDPKIKSSARHPPRKRPNSKSSHSDRKNSREDHKNAGTTLTKRLQSSNLRENDENINVVPRRGKRIILLNNPPYRDIMTGNKTGYMTPLSVKNVPFSQNNSVQNLRSSKDRPTFKEYRGPILTSNQMQNLSNPRLEKSNRFEKGYFMPPTLFKKPNPPNIGLKNSQLDVTEGAASLLTETKCEISEVSNQSNFSENCKITNEIFGEIMHNKCIIEIEDDDDSVNIFNIDL